MKEFFLTRIKSIINALEGWGIVIKTQRNTWIHAVVSVVIFIMGIWLGLDGTSWALITLAVALVWIAEFLNTALEAVVDLASPSIHPLAKRGKDIGAAAVLLASVTAIIVGIFVLGQPLIEKIKFLFQSP